MWCVCICVCESYVHKLLEGDLAILVLVHGLAELRDDLSDAVARQRQIGSFEQVGELPGTDVAITVHICRTQEFLITCVCVCVCLGVCMCVCLCVSLVCVCVCVCVRL